MTGRETDIFCFKMHFWTQVDSRDPSLFAPVHMHPQVILQTNCVQIFLLLGHLSWKVKRPQTPLFCLSVARLVPNLYSHQVSFGQKCLPEWRLVILFHWHSNHTHQCSLHLSFFSCIDDIFSCNVLAWDTLALTLQNICVVKCNPDHLGK